jgi:hypothetical protein
MWITNGGFADFFTVFVQIDGDQFSALLVEAKSEGIKLGEEEKKMGIKGSSTCQIFFENVKVPAENLLGEVGKGHRIAFNVLNIGRFKLCNSVTGGAKSCFETALTYANERIQFKTPIAEFGAIKHKLASMAIKIFASESATYRVSGLIDNMIKAKIDEGMASYDAKKIAAEEYAIECALLKVYGSETADYVVDEALQIHGGMGYSEEMPTARGYRDSRINRIYEGTNEINRLLSTGMVLKRAMKGRLDLMNTAMILQQELMSGNNISNGQESHTMAKAEHLLKMSKKTWLMVVGAAAQTLTTKMESEQEIMMLISDMAMEILVSESALLRTKQFIDQHGEDKCAVPIAITDVLCSELIVKCQNWGTEAISGFAEGEMINMLMSGLKKLTKLKAENLIKKRRMIAESFNKNGSYYINRAFKANA